MMVVVLVVVMVDGVGFGLGSLFLDVCVVGCLMGDGDLGRWQTVIVLVVED